MKKIILTLFLIFVLLMGNSFANQRSINIYVNNEGLSRSKIAFDIEPFINRDNVILVPIRFVSQSLGYDVHWNGDYNQVEIKSENSEIIVPINKNISLVNNEVKKFDTMTILKENRTFVPLRFVSEVFGANIEYQSGYDYNSHGEIAHIIDINVKK